MEIAHFPAFGEGEIPGAFSGEVAVRSPRRRAQGALQRPGGDRLAERSRALGHRKHRAEQITAPPAQCSRATLGPGTVPEDAPGRENRCLFLEAKSRPFSFHHFIPPHALLRTLDGCSSSGQHPPGGRAGMSPEPFSLGQARRPRPQPPSPSPARAVRAVGPASCPCLCRASLACFFPILKMLFSVGRARISVVV